MDDKTKKACIDYINTNAASLHGVEKKYLDIGPDVKVEDIVSANVLGDEAHLVVDRGVKGAPKYVIPLELLGQIKEAYVALNPDPVEVEAEKVDALQKKYQGRK